MGFSVEADIAVGLLCNISKLLEFDLRKRDLIVLEVDRFAGRGLLVGGIDGRATV